MAISELMPPSKAVYGYRQFEAVKFKAEKLPDNVTDQDGSQLVEGQHLCELHVYWTNGEEKPAYIVILKQKAWIHPARNGLMRKGLTSRGHIHHTTALSALVLDQSMKPFTKGVDLIEYGPKGYMDNRAGYDFKVPMRIKVEGEGGYRPAITWVASDREAYDTIGWGLKDKTSFNDKQSSWLYHALAPWDPTKLPPETLAKLQSWSGTPLCVNNSIDIVEFPKSTFEMFHAASITAWRFDGSLVDQSNGKRDLHLNFTLGLASHLALLSWIPKKNGHNLAPVSVKLDAKLSLNLGEIAKEI